MGRYFKGWITSSEGSKARKKYEDTMSLLRNNDLDTALECTRKVNLLLCTVIKQNQS